jgi:hypothetical protein
MSYIENLILSNSPIYNEGPDLWLVHVSLHYFDIIEMYCPDRVMRPFGLSQHIPDYIVIGDELHNISHQGKRKENWLANHASYLDL